LYNKGESNSHLIKRISAERVQKKQDLIKIHSLMSNVAGSKESLFCLIESYQQDVLQEGIVASLTTQFEKQYGDFSRVNITCPASGALANEVEQCQAGSTELTIFCVVYEKYLGIKAWFDSSIDILNTRKLVSLKEVDDLVKLLNDDEKISIDQMTKHE
ncbi:MAG: hypothetical protein NTX25_03625, partial [Proteobacteria bacterium]|nr:hypothetical protein [Pseudomonadota bacterium]